MNIVERALRAADFEPPEDWTPRGIEEEEVKRLIADALMSAAAAGHPRRLGGSATREELRKDKSLSRRMSHLYMTVLRFYGAGVGDWRTVQRIATESQDARRDGAQVIWDAWIPERVTWLEQRADQVAKYAYVEGLSAWGNKAIFRLDRERELIQLANERIY